MSDSKRSGYYGFKVIGALKISSGAIALIAGIAATHFLAHDPAPRIERMITHLGLDPQNRIIHRVIAAVTGVDQTHLRAIEAGTFFYALLHLVEGIGLILERTWAGYLVIVATGSLVPFEIYEIFKRPTPLKFTLFVLNVGIVVYLIAALRKEHLNKSARQA